MSSIRPIITMPVPPEVYGSDMSYGDFWRHQYRKLLDMAKEVEASRDQLAIQIRALEAEVTRLERLATNHV